MTKKKSGHLVVLSSPSGGGKTTIIRKLMTRNKAFGYSVSVTTRPPREGERDGIDYCFLNKEEFHKKRVRGQLIEWENVHGHLYGTPQEPVERMLKGGRVVLLDVDVFGGISIKKRYSDTLLIFVKPPSRESLKARLRGRGSESELEIENRLRRLPTEYQRASAYDLVVVNKKLDHTVEEIYGHLFRLGFIKENNG
ncbi:guanylate kinase [candidate division KSB1 bacterium]|nr:guanylate kinase [candidate division KSB1 bacterium]